MTSAKQVVFDVLRSMPDDCSLEDIQYEPYVREALADGERAADEGRVAPHEDVLREAARWLEG